MRACTLIGCADGLSVNVAGVRSATAVVELTVDGVTQRSECQTVNGRCAAFFANATATQASITVRMGQETVQRTVAVTYRTTQPNGPGCQPICKQATVDINVG